jgi:anti-sigma-K factor RskA
MIEQAWNEYRGWAKRARSLQANTDRWNFWAMVVLVATGVLGAACGFFAANPTNGLPGWPAQDEFARALACLAAVASALSLYVGRQALAVGAESGWLRARATAEAIKSECFRFAGGVGDYAPDKASDGDQASAFIERRKALAARAAGDSLTPEDDSVGAAVDDRRPSRPMTDKWYVANRIDGQIDFYRKGQEKNENAYQRLQLWSFVAGAAVAVVSAVAAVYGARFAAWTGALTTAGAAVSAYGLAERQKYLAASYAAMKANLERLKERYLVGGVTLETLVATAEDLMESEHAAWIDRMTKTIRDAPSPPSQAGSS